MSPPATLSFRERYGPEASPARDGILLDLQTGSYFRLNASAVAICDALRTFDEPKMVIDQVASVLRIARDEASRAVKEIVSGVAATVARELPVTPLYFDAHPDGSAVLLEEGRPILSI